MSNGMLTLQQQNMGSVGLSIDSSQLLQITQLMNDLQQSGGAHQMIIDSTPNDHQHQQQPTTHVLDIMGQQHGQQHDLFNAVNMSNNMLVSPIKIDQSNVSSSNGQVYMLDPGGGGAQQNQHQQMGQNQVHTIMLNGQPALFIPASSAISSNLLCQMMQINNVNQPNSTGTNFDLQNSAPVQLQLANGTDYSNLLSNQLIMTTEGATVNTKISPGRDVSSAQSMVNIMNGCQTENAQYNNIALIPVSSTSTASTSNGHNQTTAAHTNEMTNFVCKLESFEQDEQYQHQQQQQHQHQQSTSLTQINQHLHQQQQQHIAATAHSQIPQQVICIQPDGNITLQTLQSIHQLQQQQQQQSASMIVQPTAQILVNKPVNVTTNGNQKGKKVVKEKQISTNANKTIANLGASAGKATANEKTPSSNKGKAKVGELLSDVRGKKNQQPQQQQQQQQQIAIQPAQASVQYQLQPFDQQQWIIFNNMADLNAINNTTATLVASAPVSTVAATTTNTTGGTSNSSASSTTNANKFNDIFDIPAKVPELYSNKKRRKACDCPNCVKIKQNGLSKDDQGKKRTHKCHKCPKEYNKTSHLRAHLRGHDNFRPYVCDFKQCGKSFTRSDELKRHRRIHFDDRNFPCVICKKRFLRSDHLNKHLLVHTKAASTFTSSPFKLSSSSSSASRNSTTSPNKNSNNSSTTPSKKSKHVNEIITESSSNLNADSAASMLSSSSSSSSSASASAIESSLLLT